MATLQFDKAGPFTSIKADAYPKRYYRVGKIEPNGSGAGFTIYDERGAMIFKVEPDDTVQYNGSTLGGDAEGIIEQLLPVFPDANTSAGGTGWIGQLFQPGQNNPYDNIFQNTLSGAIQWQRVDVGIYTGTLAGAFPLYRTRFVYSGYTAEGKFIAITRQDEDTIQIYQTDQVLIPVDGLSFFDLEIKVFPTSQLND